MSASAAIRERVPVALGLLCAAALVFGVRVFGFEWVFVGDDVVFPPADAQYHLRRAFYTFVTFPDVLLFDPYINYPGGASVPWPPLYDFALGAVARLFADDQHGFEVVVAWAGPLLAVLAVVPIYLTARRVAPRWIACFAVLLFALFPMSVNYSRVGNADHHAAVGLIGAWLLYCCVALADPAVSPRRLRRLGLLLYAVRVGLLLTWHGSLLYLALAEACLLLAGIGFARPALLRTQALSALVALLTIAPLLALMPTPLGGDYSSIALSRLHLLALSSVAFVAGALYWLGDRRPELGRIAGLGAAGALGLGYVALLALLPDTRQGLTPAFEFLTMSDGMGHLTGEQFPIFSLFGRSAGRPAEISWGWLAYLIPLAPAAVALRLRDDSGLAIPAAPRLVLAGWGVFFGGLALLQRRYGNDLAPTAAILFALGIAGTLRLLMNRIAPLRGMPGRRFAEPALALLVGALLLWPALSGFHAPRFRDSRAALAGDQTVLTRTRDSVASTLTRFAKQVRDVTPETSRYFGGPVEPEYGVIAHPNLGHALQYAARRPTATDPFWEYIGEENWRRTQRFQLARREVEALRIAAALKGRFVVTMPDAPPGSVSAQLHLQDGRAVAGRPALGRFRLLVESNRSGQTIGQIFSQQAAHAVPYKLFEIVRGARLELTGAPDRKCVVDLELRSNTGRLVRYQRRAVLDADGRASLLLPYATNRTGATHATGPYRVRIGGRRFSLDVSDREVRSGARLELPPSAEAAPGKL